MGALQVDRGAQDHENTSLDTSPIDFLIKTGTYEGLWVGSGGVSGNWICGCLVGPSAGMPVPVVWCGVFGQVGPNREPRPSLGNA